jgi:ATP phosphoribosyltransferase regulatory subunit
MTEGADPDRWPDAAPLPAGARDVLPVEGEELAAIEASFRSAFTSFGYREVRTPVLEFAEVMDRAQEGGLGGRAFRLFDDHGEVLVLRPDLTIPVARLVAGRLRDHPGPVRVSYVAQAIRPAPAGKARPAEERQAGIELVGIAGPAADAEVIAILVEALRGFGLAGLRVGVGDVELTRAVLAGIGVAPEAQARLRSAAEARNLVAWRRAAAELPVPEPAQRIAAGLPAMRGGAEVLERLREAVPATAPECARVAEMLRLLEAHGAADAVLVDLGVLRDWGYYSGVVFEAYLPGVARPVAMGGRYDGLAARFGRPRPAVGVGISLDLVHAALAARDGDTSPREGVVIAGGLDEELATAAAVRRAGIPAIGAPATEGAATALAQADGWRFAARRADGVLELADLGAGTVVGCDDLAEGIRSTRS